MKSNIGTIFWILLLGAIIRFFLSFLPAFEADQNAFRVWAERLVNLGPAQFYSTQVFTNNPLGILYFFWLIGVVKSLILPSIPFDSTIDPLLKLAGNISDLMIGFLIYKIVRKKLSEKLANLAALFYIFNPGLIFNSAIWGQYDSLAILFLVSTVYFCIIKKSPAISAIFFSLACITKPQSLQLAPFLFFYFLKNFKLLQWVYSIAAFAVTAVILFIPFFPTNPLYGIYSVLTGSTNLFTCTTCNALNFWGILGDWKNDMDLFLNIPLLYWGFIMLIGCLILIFNLKKLKTDVFYFTLSISMLAFFMLLTRMHERYLAYFFPFLVLSFIFLKSKVLMGFYIFFSFIYLLNLYIPYSYYDNLAKITKLPVDGLFNNFSSFSFISFFGFVLILVYYLNYVRRSQNS